MFAIGAGRHLPNLLLRSEIHGQKYSQNWLVGGPACRFPGFFEAKPANGLWVIGVNARLF